jgi:hypothetical protein
MEPSDFHESEYSDRVHTWVSLSDARQNEQPPQLTASEWVQAIPYGPFLDPILQRCSPLKILLFFGALRAGYGAGQLRGWGMVPALGLPRAF